MEKIKKGWKKVKNRKNIVTYEYITHFGRVVSFVQVFKDKSHSPPHRFTYHKAGRIQKEKLFTSKVKARSYAVKFMKTNPNG